MKIPDRVNREIDDRTEKARDPANLDSEAPVNLGKEGKCIRKVVWNTQYGIHFRNKRIVEGKIEYLGI